MKRPDEEGEEAATVADVEDRCSDRPSPRSGASIPGGGGLRKTMEKMPCGSPSSVDEGGRQLYQGPRHQYSLSPPYRREIVGQLQARRSSGGMTSR